MDGDVQRGRLRTFVLGGLVGASAVLAAARRRRAGAAKRPPRAGLAAFEDAPCYLELVERERVEQQHGRE
ncbi:MAG TPA: hypothetical protein VGJ58_03835 [Gaiellaceae bacterium]|jgi:hypothetical protein